MSGFALFRLPLHRRVLRRVKRVAFAIFSFAFSMRCED